MELLVGLEASRPTYWVVWGAEPLQEKGKLHFAHECSWTRSCKAPFLAEFRHPKKSPNFFFTGGASAPPDPPNESAWRPPKYWNCIGNPIQFPYLGGLQADLLGGSGGADAPQELSKVAFFSSIEGSVRGQGWRSAVMTFSG